MSKLPQGSSSPSKGQKAPKTVEKKAAEPSTQLSVQSTTQPKAQPTTKLIASAPAPPEAVQGSQKPHKPAARSDGKPSSKSVAASDSKSSSESGASSITPSVAPPALESSFERPSRERPSRLAPRANSQGNRLSPQHLTGLGSAYARTQPARQPECLPASELEGLIQSWQIDGEGLYLSETTLKERGYVLSCLDTFVREAGYKLIDERVMRTYLSHVRSGGNQKRRVLGQRKTHEVKPRTLFNHWSYLRTFFNYLVNQGYLDVSPMQNVPRPRVPQDQVQPLTREQVNALEEAAKRSHNPRRNLAILLLLVDTGMRASELCDLHVRDVDIHNNSCVVHGKGNKLRIVYFGTKTKKAVWDYIRVEDRDEDDYLFQSVRGPLAGEPMNRDGLRQLIERLGNSARIVGVRVSPHTLRHTFAIQFLRGGGNAFALQTLLGHTDLLMTRRYVNLAQADLADQHRRFSPVDQIRLVK